MKAEKNRTHITNTVEISFQRETETIQIIIYLLNKMHMKEGLYT